MHSFRGEITRRVWGFEHFTCLRGRTVEMGFKNLGFSSFVPKPLVK